MSVYMIAYLIALILAVASVAVPSRYLLQVSVVIIAGALLIQGGVK